MNKIIAFFKRLFGGRVEEKVITTGTPPGVGMGKKPQVFLKEGDTIRLSIDNLGEQNSKVIAE